MIRDLEEITTLLKDNNLPYKDLQTSNVDFLSSKNNGKVIGCIGIEVYDEEGLLRSFAVDDVYKSKGIGGRLLNALLDKSKAKGIKRLHLLTTTADVYFAKKGFNVSERRSAPTSIVNSKEFSEICPSSSVYMVKDIH